MNQSMKSRFSRSAILRCILSFAGCLLLGIGVPSMAQVKIKVPGVDMSVGDGANSGNVNISIGGKNAVGNKAGYIDEDADIEGVTVINGEVAIDGEKVPKGKTRHTGKKSGIKYVIKWGKDGNVAISQE
jgi:hypothetical protein